MEDGLKANCGIWNVGLARWFRDRDFITIDNSGHGHCVHDINVVESGIGGGQRRNT